ncbi:phage protein NinX family protein [Ectopseudomonas composti]|uniref:phage protein NinX family protein n=1 Tax=Ectopseudomonas composti TaxID=658457 RepID=UPI000773175B|nr:phage protein NinX family protein [Pseudomonas composti]
MNMIEVKTAELSGAALDWATFCAVFSGMQPTIRKIESVTIERQPFIKPLTFPSAVYLTYSGAYGVECNWNPSSAWEDGGPLIVSRMVAIDYPRPLRDGELPKWVAQCWRPYGCGEAESPLVAACRAIVAAKLGETVQIPAELLP